MGRFYFLHIPKTAGTSTIAWLRECERFRPCPHQLWSTLLAVDRAELARYDLFHGHFYCYLSSYLDEPLKTFTFLREPVQRAYSHYRHVLRDPQHYFHQRVKRHSSFLAFMEDPVTQPLVRNFQTRSLSAKFDPAALLLAKRGSDHPFWLERSLETSSSGISENDELAIAKDYLQHCVFVGIAERLDESAAMLARALGIEAASLPGRLNADADCADSPWSSQERRVAMEMNRADGFLYEFGLQLFERQRDRLRA